MSRLTRWLAPRTIAHAHCDIPCGVYDPQQARIEAESCYKIIQKYNDSTDDVFRARCLVIKEERAELAKRQSAMVRRRTPMTRPELSCSSKSPRTR